ncbi:hypothetical protein AC249_AIPGENE7620 [Exaiptasia diaphana]|nr:hypothetical protein AC249_AIPGENE7620 [Exaiptasia diaphana]
MQVAKQFIRFGSVDVKIIDPHNGLVAVAHHRRVKDVLSLVKKNKKTIVRLYNPLYDSPTMKTIIWSGGALLTVSIFVGSGILIWKVLK